MKCTDGQVLVWDGVSEQWNVAGGLQVSRFELVMLNLVELGNYEEEKSCLLFFLCLQVSRLNLEIIKICCLLVSPCEDYNNKCKYI